MIVENLVVELAHVVWRFRMLRGHIRGAVAGPIGHRSRTRLGI